ncbi:hypothetical protein AB0J80_23995 [Actinoplanes sp. NPDC049548]|uniref:hypothetical protein n=1 Tax=Actinoplanes sp. NPDC049548 TaxID=3155152 RepID=UPI00344431A5
MVRKLRQQDLDRLIRSHRNLRLSLVVALLVVIPLFLGLAAAGAPAVLLSPVAGVAIGFLLLMPQRRLLKELGLTNVEAKQILAEARKR